MPRPLRNVRRMVDNNAWQMTAVPAHVELAPEQGPLPAGWVLIRGRLRRWSADHSAQLIAEVGAAGEGVLEFPLPTSRAGIFQELIRLPGGVTRLLLEPMRQPGTFELDEVTVTPVGPLERVARMYRRIVPLFFTKSRERRKAAGLHIHTPLVDLAGAYALAGRFRAYAPEMSYTQWIEDFDSLDNGDRKRIRERVRRWRNPPRFEVIIVVRENEAAGLRSTLAALDAQLYDGFRVTVIAPSHLEIGPDLPRSGRGVDVLRIEPENGSTEPVAARLPSDNGRAWTLFLQTGMRLAEHALYWLASEALSDGNVRFLYADHDHLDDAGRRVAPVFKPDWSPELLRSTEYIGPAAAVRSDALKQAVGPVGALLTPPDRHDLYLRVTERMPAQAIRHIPALLWHIPSTQTGSPDLSRTQSPNPVAAHLGRLGVAASAERTPAGHYRVRYALPTDRPLVSIVVPTRDAVDHLRACVESILGKTSYRETELLVVDNGSEDPAARSYLDGLMRRPKVRVLRYNSPFNYAAINNFAVRHAAGEVLCLLNNDTEVITEEWVEEMLGLLVQPKVGVVGAKLYYPDGRIQHGGDTVGPGGCAHHLHSLVERDAPGYGCRALLAQELSAVTAACMLTWRALYSELGGLDERNLAVAFNDVDYCLRVREAGYRVVWTPYAELYHHESVSRGSESEAKDRKRSAQEANYMRKRWKHVMAHDPYYNPNLSYERPDFSLSNAPVVNRPW